jgi:hypothetical protein
MSEDHPQRDIHDTVTIMGIENLQTVWGLTEIAQLYRTPVADLVSVAEAAVIAQLQARYPRPEKWAHDVTSVVRASPDFQEWLRTLPTRALPGVGGQTGRVDPSLPWCVRLRWGAGVTDKVDIFVYTTTT